MSFSRGSGPQRVQFLLPSIWKRCEGMNEWMDWWVDGGWGHGWVDKRLSGCINACLLDLIQFHPSFHGA